MIKNANQLQVIIIGGSIGGLITANLLRKLGVNVEIFEKSADDLATRGAGIGTHEELFEVLDLIDITIDQSIGIPITGRQCLDHLGNKIAYYDAPRTMSVWSRLYHPLKEKFPASQYHFDMNLKCIEQNGNAVTALFTNGEKFSADILIGADGFRSTVRSIMMPETQPTYAGYVGWRGMINEWEMPKDLHQSMFDHYFFCLPEGEIMLCFPVPGKNNSINPGERAYNFVWYHPVEEHHELPNICTDINGKYHSISIPPPLIRPDVINEMRKIAKTKMAPQMARITELASAPFFQPIYDLKSTNVVNNRVALLGDAAFVARPHTGMGVTKAALDARKLYDALAQNESVAGALKQYQTQCCLFGKLAVERGKWCGIHLEAQTKVPRELRTPEQLMHAPPLDLMREHGAKICDIPGLKKLA
jgi:2-polyprenyl-6-methoxyphenol hydroxylase-like FAD-dependent oxidoreductase